ncbi:hypothetical protein QR680_004456 [Steinernema hermaphroditum]|uniref:Uncharacterized protein n=1 Tax=Steinernema hermaphroditum TaxID=289476 RepID=A0AA39HQZ5_9BILA|nr:hypothetical protein QR680_004456 [Steinernema hermaphroditum]
MVLIRTYICVLLSILHFEQVLCCFPSGSNEPPTTTAPPTTTSTTSTTTTTSRTTTRSTTTTSTTTTSTTITLCKKLKYDIMFGHDVKWDAIDQNDQPERIREFINNFEMGPNEGQAQFGSRMKPIIDDNYFGVGAAKDQQALYQRIKDAWATNAEIWKGPYTRNQGEMLNQIVNAYFSRDEAVKVAIIFMACWIYDGPSPTYTEAGDLAQKKKVITYVIFHTEYCIGREYANTGGVSHKTEKMHLRSVGRQLARDTGRVFLSKNTAKENLKPIFDKIYNDLMCMDPCRNQWGNVCATNRRYPDPDSWKQ